MDRQQPVHGPDAAPEVSVIIPVYNAAATLDVAVMSVLSQSLVAIEVILVDDGSSDGSPEQARALAQRDPRVRTYRHGCNRGQAAARNLALSEARGRWIAVVDADDEIGPDRLRSMVEAGDALGADLIADSVEFAGIHTHGTPGRLRACDTPDGRPQVLTLEALIESDIPLNGQCSYGYLKPLMRRAFMDRWALRYDESLRFSEDLNFYVQALLHGAHFVLDPRTEYVYNQTPISVSRNGRVLPRVANQAMQNNQRMRELAAASGRADLDALIRKHGQRWSTVLWFNQLKLAMRNRRIGEVLRLTLDCPGGARGAMNFVRDRARTGHAWRIVKRMSANALQTAGGLRRSGR